MFGFFLLFQSFTSKRENVTPDYPLTLLEGLTTIGHFCLLDHPNPTKKVCGNPLTAESHPLSFQGNKTVNCTRK